MPKKLLFVLLLSGLSVLLFGCDTNSFYARETRLLRQEYVELESIENAFKNEFVPKDSAEAQYVKLTVPDPGYDIYNPSPRLGYDYRYGPSILENEDGSLDAWFAATGDGAEELDWISWRHSEDGETWQEEKVVLTPTPDSLDALSVCDPDAFFYDGYYYLGYTSTIDDTDQGINNSVFLARSTRPDGPYEKWNGNGWGGAPQPIIYYDGVCLGWGNGEPSFVIVDDTIYVYSTKDSFTLDFQRVRTTEVRTADITKEDWPKNLTFQGYACIRTDTDTAEFPDAEYVYSDCDSWDVAYIEDSGIFLAVCTNRRFKSNSCILYFESTDGVHFLRVSELNTNIICGCHNCAIKTYGNGHIRSDEETLIGYAYTGTGISKWGFWATRFAPLKIELSNELDRSDEACENLRQAFSYRSRPAEYTPLTICAENTIYRKYLNEEPLSINFYWRDINYGTHYVDRTEITFDDYDESIIAIDESNRILALSEGTTRLRFEYHGLYRELCIKVIPQDLPRGEMTDFYAVESDYYINIPQAYAAAIRPVAKFNGSEICELNNRSILTYGVTFDVADESVCTVRGDCVIIPGTAGDTTITVSCDTGHSFTVNVHITDNPAWESF
ncbi:MAG: hypothetical protein IJT16_13080 [Lachnospiraceae bacterium]|nr:hypothetical protein [Lachnospiraceae bacterium]